jgi:hypothetical protein
LWEFHRLAKKESGASHLPAAEVVDFMNYLPALAAQAEYKLEAFQKKLDLLACAKI